MDYAHRTTFESFGSKAIKRMASRKSGERECDLFRVPPDLEVAKRISLLSKIYKNYHSLQPYRLMDPVDDMTNLHIGVRVYVKCLQLMIRFSIFLCIFVMLPSIIFNMAEFFHFEKNHNRSNCEYRNLEAKILWCILVYPLDQIYMEQLKEVLFRFLG